MSTPWPPPKPTDGRLGTIQQFAGELDYSVRAQDAFEARCIQLDAERCVEKVRAARAALAATSGDTRKARAAVTNANLVANQAAARAGWETLPEGVEPDGMFY